MKEVIPLDLSVTVCRIVNGSALLIETLTVTGAVPGMFRFVPFQGTTQVMDRLLSLCHLA